MLAPAWVSRVSRPVSTGVLFSGIFAATLFAIVVTPEKAFAHGGAVQTFVSTTTEGHIIDVDYDSPPLVAEGAGRFTFGLFSDDSRTEGLEFTDLWVRIIKGGDENGQRGETIFAGPILKADYGGTGFVYVFANEGQYTLNVRYNNSKKNDSGQNVAEATIPLTVLPPYGRSGFDFGLSFFLGFIIGCVVAFAILGMYIYVRKNR